MADRRTTYLVRGNACRPPMKTALEFGLILSEHSSSGTRATSARWYAVQCLSNREFIAKAQLENQGFEVFLPCIEKTARHARKFTLVRKSLFPGYLFVRLDLECERWRSINGTLGVARLVARGDGPSAAPSGIIEAIAQACDASGVMHMAAELSDGDRVRVTQGPFADLIGTLERLDGAARVRVLLDLMGTQASVVLARHQVIAEAA